MSASNNPQNPPYTRPANTPVEELHFYRDNQTPLIRRTHIINQTGAEVVVVFHHRPRRDEGGPPLSDSVMSRPGSMAPDSRRSSLVPIRLDEPQRTGYTPRLESAPPGSGFGSDRYDLTPAVGTPSTLAREREEARARAANNQGDSPGLVNGNRWPSEGAGNSR
jgi:hypothetical protein